jgi:DNA-binding response OmpR family regulator
MKVQKTSLKDLNLNRDFSILIIDDLLSIREELVKDLRGLEYTGEIIEAETLNQAKILLEKFKFNLVICDRNLPDGSGVNFLKAMRDFTHSADTPLIMCTKINEPALIVEAINAGVNEYLTKPWTKDQLAIKILSVL